MFSGFNWFIKLTEDWYLYFLNYVRVLPKNVKAFWFHVKLFRILWSSFETKKAPPIWRGFLV